MIIVHYYVHVQGCKYRKSWIMQTVWLVNRKQIDLKYKNTNFVIFCPTQNKITYQPKLVIFDTEHKKKT